LNLVKNAIDAMSTVAPDGRFLDLATRLERNLIVRLSVQHSGGGIPSEDQDRIFEPFFTTKAAGMGLGLAVCPTIVEDHGGKVRLAKSDSRGSIFDVTLPVAG
jgi:C4-dicarboxylate-specific signal transduction histidine kinase